MPLLKSCHQDNSNPHADKTPSIRGLDSVGLDYQESRLPFYWSQRRAITLIACRKQKANIRCVFQIT